MPTDDTPTPALKACPFCDGTNFMRMPDDDNPDERPSITCWGCGAIMAWPSVEKTIAAWNRRTPSPQATDEARALACEAVHPFTAHASYARWFDKGKSEPPCKQVAAALAAAERRGRETTLACRNGAEHTDAIYCEACLQAGLAAARAEALKGDKP